jgi:hypothetical protein
MRVQRSVQILTVLTTLATLAACSSYGRGSRNEPDPRYSTSTVVVWDSGPLDQEYNRERTNMDGRHNQEIANPRSGESSDQRVQRQGAEKQDLEHRYAQGKASHSKSLPPSDSKGRDGKSDKTQK